MLFPLFMQWMPTSRILILKPFWSSRLGYKKRKRPVFWMLIWKLSAKHRAQRRARKGRSFQKPLRVDTPWETSKHTALVWATGGHDFPHGAGGFYICPFLCPPHLPVPPTLPHIPLPSHATLSRFYSSHLRAGHACKQVLSIFIPAPHVGFETRFVRWAK